MGMQVSFPDDDYGRVEKPLVSSAEDIDGLAFFDPSRRSECPKFTRCITEALEETRKILPEDLEICGLSWGPISTAGYIMGVEEMIMDILLDGGLAPKLVKKCAGFVAEQQKAMHEAGATVMWMADPTASGDILSPDMYAMPMDAVKDVVSYYKRECGGAAYVHICGDTTKLIPLVAGTGADCMSFDHAVDPAAARRAAGRRIALMGNIDPVKYIMQGDPDTVKRVCSGIIDVCGSESGFILAPGCETPISSPDANVRAMGEAGRDRRSALPSPGTCMSSTPRRITRRKNHPARDIVSPRNRPATA